MAKLIAAELAGRYSGVSQREAGRALGYRGNGAVGKLRAFLRTRLATDADLARRLNSLRAKLARVYFLFSRARPDAARP